MVKCPVCDGAIDVEEDDVDEGDSISCDECGADLKVIGTDPLELESAEEVEEEEEEFTEDAEEEESEEDWKERERKVELSLLTNQSRRPSFRREHPVSRIWILALACVLLCAAPAVFAAKKDVDSTVRSVQGTVATAQGDSVNGAVVQLKNTKTLQIRSFITRDNGAYYFHGLSKDVDYELRADFQGSASATRTLSSFDSRNPAVMNLKLVPGKK
jgi:lysine biosynthesis protein LysW